MTRFDDKLDEDILELKEREYKSSLQLIRSKIEELNTINPNYFEDGCKTLELSNRIFPLYLKGAPSEKAEILRLIALNYSLTGTSIRATYRKPFNFMENFASCPIKLPQLDNFHNFLMFNYQEHITDFLKQVTT